MSHRGFSHIGLSTRDLDKTRAFYEEVLGFKPVAVDRRTVTEAASPGTSSSMSGRAASPFWAGTSRIRRTMTRA